MADAAAAAALHAESELELFLTQIKLPQHTAVLLELGYDDVEDYEKIDDEGLDGQV